MRAYINTLQRYNSETRSFADAREFDAEFRGVSAEFGNAVAIHRGTCFLGAIDHQKLHGGRDVRPMLAQQSAVAADAARRRWQARRDDNKWTIAHQSFGRAAEIVPQKVRI